MSDSVAVSPMSDSAAISLEPIDAKPESLTDMVFRRIRDGIVAKTLRPGNVISEAGLADQLGVSKTPVREALLRLQDIGLIVTDGKRGNRIVEPSLTLIEHAFDVRMALEGFAARRAAEVAQTPATATLERLAAESVARAEAGDSPGFRQLDEQFHLAVAHATENELLRRLVENAYTLAWALRQRDVPSFDHQRSCAQEHLSISDAIADRDASLAEQRMAAHIDTSRRLVLETIAHFGQGSEVVDGPVQPLTS
jgi:DNA-binding GntR family transcriptional regulator